MRRKEISMNTNTAKKDKISIFEMVAYGLGGFGRGMFNAIAMGYLNYYYTNSLGLSAATVGMVFMLSRIFDGVTDITVGALVDKTKAKFGKARIWLLWTVIPFGLSTFLLFTMPQSWGSTAQLLYIVVTYNLVTTILGTTWYVPHMTLPARMTGDQKQRSQIIIVNQILSMVAVLPFSLVFFPKIVGAGNTPEVWISAMRIYAILGSAAMAICVFGTKERVNTEETGKIKEKKYTIGQMLKALLTNKYWFIVLFIFIFDAMSNNFASAVSTYYCQYILGDATILSKANMQITAALADIIIPGHGNYFRAADYMWPADTEDSVMPESEPGVIGAYTRLREFIDDPNKVAVLLKNAPFANVASLRIARDVPLEALILNMAPEIQENREKLMADLNRA